MKLKIFCLIVISFFYPKALDAQGYLVTVNNEKYRYSNLKIKDGEVKVVNSGGKNAKIPLKDVVYKIQFSDKSIYDLVYINEREKYFFLKRLNDGEIKFYELTLNEYVFNHLYEQYALKQFVKPNSPYEKEEVKFFFISKENETLELPYTKESFLPFQSRKFQSNKVKRTLRLQRIDILKKVFVYDSVALKVIKSPGFAASIGDVKLIAKDYSLRNHETRNSTDSTSLTILRSPKDQVNQPVDIYVGDKLVIKELKVGELVKIKVPTGVDFLLCSNKKYCEVVFSPARPVRYIDLKFKGIDIGYRYDFVGGEEISKVLEHVKFRE